MDLIERAEKERRQRISETVFDYEQAATGLSRCAHDCHLSVAPHEHRITTTAFIGIRHEEIALVGGRLGFYMKCRIERK